MLTGTRRQTLRKAAAAVAARRRRRSAVPVPLAVDASPASEAVFQALREWRRGVAKEHKVPAYTVLHDASLREIAQRLPATLAALQGVTGIGAAKLERYGAQIVDVVSQAR